jgi:hypothetical protein
MNTPSSFETPSVDHFRQLTCVCEMNVVLTWCQEAVVEFMGFCLLCGSG